MKALSIRQPWVWAILHAGKPVENRTWAAPRAVIGERILLHAAKGMTHQEVIDARNFMRDRGLLTLATWNRHWPGIKEVPRGGIVGVARLVDCVTMHGSGWFLGPYGFVLDQVRRTKFVPWKGALGFFEVPTHIALIALGGEVGQ